MAAVADAIISAENEIFLMDWQLETNFLIFFLIHTHDNLKNVCMQA